MNIEEFNNAIKNNIVSQYTLHDDVDSYGNPNSWIKLTNKNDIEAIAKSVSAHKGRCVVMSVYRNEDGSHMLIYHFDIDGMLINVEVPLASDDKNFISITPILPSANWAEREAREMYNLEPVGHPCKDRLFLDPSMPKGEMAEYISLSKAQVGLSDTDILWNKVNEGIK